MHGGASPQAIAAADRRKALADAEETVRALGLPQEIDPAEALLAEVHRTAGHVAWLEARIHATQPDDLVWGVVKHRAGLGPEGPIDVTDEAAVPSVWLELYHRERTHLVKVCTAALAAGVEERRVRLAEQQGALLASVIRAVLDDPELGLDPARRHTADGVVRRHLLAVAGGLA